MEFEVTLKIKVDSDMFLLDCTSNRVSAVNEEVLNALYDLDDIKVLSIGTSEVGD